MLAAGPGFFETLRIPLVYGRVFDGRDRADTPRVAVVTETMARQFFGTVNAVGRRFRPENDPTAWTEVIGVVGDTGTGEFGNDVLDPIPQLYYRSHTQSDTLPTTIVARTSRDAADLVAAMQRELRGVDAALPVMAAKTMAQDLEDSRLQPKVIAMFLGVLGALGLLLASIGLYAVVAFAVARRSREIGIRMALGARSQQVVWSVARGVSGLVGAGTAVGLVLSVLAMLTLRAASAPAGNRHRQHRPLQPGDRPAGAPRHCGRHGRRGRRRRVRAGAPCRADEPARGAAAGVRPVDVHIPHIAWIDVPVIA